ncbi:MULTISPECIES: phenylalanine--tRNA ligase subunit beta [unclassified Haematospirillum]|uniref:phenylalanine--tRNA ligase subunit beta n=1 Tax=unclassified Haematospirillum TaxID=2622088 RepID=UPI0014387C45|nr:MULTISPECIES: phenylalanine--tRNA ligase subunit beta [unclassified Haematospirillum]NKD55085.1 phenylalanine--tRNA ligase subunit beta [Haematospirillum sp. H4890]NKD75338.1 phenylalanine--tRNA ligase subunit beta [Haematospirillum sp. H4485]
MKFTLSWLKDHLETDASLDEIGKTLTSIGLEVESITDPAATLDGFTTGHVKTAEKHPDADRLRLCTVDIGDKTLQIVCGAPNARAGIKVAVAVPGCIIPATGDVLKKGTVRGQESQGMMCSSRELCLGEDHDGIIELPDDTPVGLPLATALDLDPVLDISVTPNRADCLGIRGIARDLAAAGLGTLKADTLAVTAVPAAFTSGLSIIRDLPEDADTACPYFAGRLIRGVRNGESSAWLKNRLNAIGLRPISALVDVTNYLTFGWNRPLHVFDAGRISGPLTVRMAKEGESLLALNNRVCTLDTSMVVIADAKGVQSVGGVIGGMESSCTEDTTDVIIEAALFDPARIATTGRRLNIVSDARYRFERGIDPASVIEGMERATRLIMDLCGGEPGDIVTVGTAPSWQKSITLRPERVEKLVGMTVGIEQMLSLLDRLGCAPKLENGVIRAAPPSWRVDLEAEHDLVEEIARLHGYDNLEAIPLPRKSMPVRILSPRQKITRLVARTLASRGLHETVTWSFMSSDHAHAFGGGQDSVRLANPISADLDVMRPSILPNLIAAASRNAARGITDLGLFETGPQFQGGMPGQQKLMATGLRTGKTGPRHWDTRPRTVDVFDARADALAVLEAVGVATVNLQITADAPAWYHPGRSGSLRLGPTLVATFGEIHPRVQRMMDAKGSMVGFEVFLEALPLPRNKPGKARPLLKASPFQPLERDFAFVVGKDICADTMLRAARSADKTLITAVSVFDVYEGPNVPEGQKSIALSATLQPIDRTLTDEDIDGVCHKIVAAVEKASGGTQRA